MEEPRSERKEPLPAVRTSQPWLAFQQVFGDSTMEVDFSGPSGWAAEDQPTSISAFGFRES